MFRKFRPIIQQKNLPRIIGQVEATNVLIFMVYIHGIYVSGYFHIFTNHTYIVIYNYIYISMYQPTPIILPRKTAEKKLQGSNQPTRPCLQFAKRQSSSGVVLVIRKSLP